MKTTISNKEAVSLDKIEKKITQILGIINNIRPNFFVNGFKFSKKANEEKVFLFKSLISKKALLIEATTELFIQILNDTKFYELNKEDQDFLLGLEKTEFADSQYVREINTYVANATCPEEIFSNMMEENLYFMLLNTELNTISTRLLNLN